MEVLEEISKIAEKDLVYDQITAVRDLAFRMLALGTDILKDRI